MNPRITYLWQRFTARKATRAELDELMALLSTGDHDEESRQYLQQLFEATPAEKEDRARWEPVLETILHPVGALEETHRLIRRAVAAAAVILLMAGGFWLWRAERSAKRVSAAVAEVTPGGNRAVLTLAGGQKVILDSAAIGTLAVQGSTHVEKLADGQLAYEREDKTGQAPSLYNTMTTPRGGQYQLTLSDGTKVWLNAASSITYPITFNGHSRPVEVTGEVYFEVKHDEKRPFMVKVGGQTIEDIGTRFNVNAYMDEPAQVTTLLEGAVKVGEHILSPGDQAAVTAAGTIEVSKGDPEQAVAWKNGLFDFSDASLQEVMRQLGRWYDVEVTYEGNVPARQFNGMIGRSLNLSQVLKGLAKERVHYRIEAGNKLIITP